MAFGRSSAAALAQAVAAWTHVDLLATLIGSRVRADALAALFGPTPHRSSREELSDDWDDSWDPFHTPSMPAP